MIRIDKLQAPPILLDAGKQATEKLCKLYDEHEDYRTGKQLFEFDAKKQGKLLYSHPEVKTALRLAQHDKCAFCESRITHIDYGTIEHFRPKAGSKQNSADELLQPGYFWLAYDWENLFFACSLCNEQFKQNLFPLQNPQKRARSHHDDLTQEKPLLIDPSKETPTEWIEFPPSQPDCPAPRNKSRRGRKTIKVFGLDREELNEMRRDCLNDLKVFVKLREKLRKEVPTDPMLGEIEAAISRKIHPSSEFSAMCRAYLEHHADQP
jgi:uncharacterized protein (TIGR02646 family)